MKNEIIVILGKKGSGKTEMARHVVSDKARLLIYDPVRQFSGSGVIVHNAVDLIDYLEGVRSANFRVVYQPQYDIEDMDVAGEEFKNACRIVNCLHDVYFLVDEIDSYTSRNYCPPFFNNLIQRGRHSRISIVVTTRRHTETTRHITAQADVLISFHQHEPADIKYLGSFFGEKALELPKLPSYHYLRFDESGVTLHNPIEVKHG